jgi:hypothetical protein
MNLDIIAIFGFLATEKVNYNLNIINSNSAIHTMTVHNQTIIGIMKYKNQGN